MRVVIVPPKGDVEVVDTDEKYLLNAGHKLLGEDKYLQYYIPKRGMCIVYDDDAMLKGEPEGPLLCFGTIMVAHIIDSDENDLIIGDMPLADIDRFLRLNSK